MTTQTQPNTAPVPLTDILPANAASYAVSYMRREHVRREGRFCVTVKDGVGYEFHCPGHQGLDEGETVAAAFRMEGGWRVRVPGGEWREVEG